MEPRSDHTYLYTSPIGWGDCDPANIVYTGRLPWFALNAINAWWEAHFNGDGWFQMELDHNVGTPFVRLEMDFFKPVTPRFNLDSYVWPAKLGDSSITFRVDGEQNGALCFSTRTVSVFIVADQFKKQRIPENYRQKLESCLPGTANQDCIDG